MPDFKFWASAPSLQYVKAKDYPAVARRNVREMHRQTGVLKCDEQGLAKRGVLVRHLVMPGETAGTEPIMRLLANEVSRDTYVNAMGQYRPAGRVSAAQFVEINRHISRAAVRPRSGSGSPGRAVADRRSAAALGGSRRRERLEVPEDAKPSIRQSQRLLAPRLRLRAPEERKPDTESWAHLRAAPDGDR